MSLWPSLVSHELRWTQFNILCNSFCKYYHHHNHHNNCPLHSFIIIIISIIWCNLKEDVVAACAVETTGRRCQHPLNSPPCICISNWTSYLYSNSYLDSYFNSTLCSAQRRGKCWRLLNLHLFVWWNLAYNFVFFCFWILYLCLQLVCICPFSKFVICL